jgi:hypothetical protein
MLTFKDSGFPIILEKYCFTPQFEVVRTRLPLPYDLNEVFWMVRDLVVSGRCCV